MILISDNKRSRLPDPPEGALDSVSRPVAIPESVVPSIEVFIIAPTGSEKVDLPSSLPFPSWCAEVALAPHCVFVAGSLCGTQMSVMTVARGETLAG
jgi:hypothetical protein